MTNGENKDYSFGNKSNWRRWKWNRIVERLSVRPSEAIVLYLAGREDLDRPIALRRGFRDENLIAVDRSASVVDDLRRKGTIAIQSQLVDCVMSWSPGRRIDVLDADLCCDAIDSLCSGMDLAITCSPELRDAVLSINLCRGRGASLQRINDLKDKGRPKHRGKLFVEQLIREATGLSRTEGEIEPHIATALYEAVVQNLQPAYSEYYSKDSKQYFDSAVFISPRRGAPSDESTDQSFRRELVRKASIVRRVRAALAHRTMRKDRIGPYREAFQ